MRKRFIRSLTTFFQWVATWLVFTPKTRLSKMTRGPLEGMYQPEIKTSSGWMAFAYPCINREDALEAMTEEMLDIKPQPPYWLHLTIVALRSTEMRLNPDSQLN